MTASDGNSLFIAANGVAGVGLLRHEITNPNNKARSRHKNEANF
jgi:hypothetical protein